ncbi:MAG: LSU ribosomal protein L27p, partial [uncultured Solirubrobacteraceae bacterium]
GTQEGPRLQPQRPRLESAVPRREDLRRPGGHGRRDHRPPARHPLQAGHRRGHRQGRHPVRQGAGHRPVPRERSRALRVGAAGRHAGGGSYAAV